MLAVIAAAWYFTVYPSLVAVGPYATESQCASAALWMAGAFQVDVSACGTAPEAAEPLAHPNIPTMGEFEINADRLEADELDTEHLGTTGPPLRGPASTDPKFILDWMRKVWRATWCEGDWLPYDEPDSWRCV